MLNIDQKCFSEGFGTAVSGSSFASDKINYFINENTKKHRLHLTYFLEGEDENYIDGKMIKSGKDTVRLILKS